MDEDIVGTGGTPSHTSVTVVTIKIIIVYL